MRSKGRYGNRIPAERIKPIITDWLEARTISELERRSGVDARQIYAIINNEREYATMHTADKLVSVGMGRPDIFHSILRDVYV